MVLFTFLISALQTAPAITPATRPAPPPLARQDDGPTGQAVLSPVVARPFTCSEHPTGQLPYAGDALGTDCMVLGGVGAEGHGFARLYRGDGNRNEDWFGWNVDVLAPVEGVVDAVLVNPEINVPGRVGKPPATIVRFKTDDDLLVVYAHLTAVKVKVGDRVHAGQVVGKVGNNGVSRGPHIHIGAYRGDVPLQIRWDLQAMARTQGE